jgi:hypothetical protein
MLGGGPGALVATQEIRRALNSARQITVQNLGVK